MDLRDPSLYLNRELSQIEFNRRVLEQARDQDTPLLERLRFLCISCTNLDEFFEVRVATIRYQLSFPGSKPWPDGLSPAEALQQIRRNVLQLVDDQYRCWNDELIPALRQEGIRFLTRDDWNARTRRWIADYVQAQLLPVLSPLGLDPAHPFPRILNKSLNLAVRLKGRDAFGREAGIALVRAPRSLPRVIQLPKEVSGGHNDFAFLSGILQAHVDLLFPGMQVKGAYPFRVTRNSELLVDEEDVENLATALRDELHERGFADAVRLEVSATCPRTMVRFLTRHFELTEAEVYRCHGPVNLNRVMAIHEMVDRPELKFPPFTARLHPAASPSSGSMFEHLGRQDLLLHHPFDSFATVAEFVRQAANDPQVLAIKQTLYRTGKQSVLVNYLIDAARAGKDVTVVVEVRARFDEEANIALANRLQEAGVQVVYGVVGYKTHCKMLLVVRREGEKLRRYAHLSTGNYHPGTSTAYTDIGLLTSDRDLCEDVNKLFSQMSGLGPVIKLKYLLQSPFTLHRGMLEKIGREIEHAAAGRPARIMAKMNSLSEPTVIQALYEASIAGVQIDLCVRGICALRPGVAGVSENIRVRSIVGRFLEHSRVYYFANGGDEELYCSSADWMDRNLLRRVEVAFPILDTELRSRVFREELENYFIDNTQAWVLNADGSYSRQSPGESAPHSAQATLLRQL
ncbi:MAG: polyphosphate kinase 1 [Lysobacterales bacterium]